MVKVLCINDENRPNEIPIEKWLKKDEEYHVIFTCTAFLDELLTKKTLAFQLNEIDLTEENAPFEFFAANRFAIRAEDVEKLKELIESSNVVTFSMNEIIEEMELQTSDL